ncbi:MAG: hypothetical protein AB8B80_06205 [Marinicellaceae bacterium]
MKTLKKALQVPFAVFSLSGELIAEGTVNGQALGLPAGFYNIKIYADEIIRDFCLIMKD